MLGSWVRATVHRASGGDGGDYVVLLRLPAPCSDTNKALQELKDLVIEGALCQRVAEIEAALSGLSQDFVARKPSPALKTPGIGEDCHAPMGGSASAVGQR